MRSRRVSTTLAITFTLLLALTVIPAAAQTPVNGPYYATPSWDQTLACTTLANCPRFLVLSNFNNEAVLDRESGLVWHRTPSAVADSWASIPSSCNTKSIGGREGWKLPSVQELGTLRILPAGHPFQVLPQYYWTSTVSVLDTSTVWGVAPSGGGTGRLTKASPNLTWCVRGGSGGDPQ
jgi:hypothetical protein